MKLIDQRNAGGGVLERTWLHSDGMGNDQFTVERVQEVDPIFDQVKQTAQNQTSKDLVYLGEVPETLLNEIVMQCAKRWGMSVKETFSEIMQSKTDRAKMIWKMLLQDRDYSKLQAKTYQ